VTFLISVDNQLLGVGVRRKGRERKWRGWETLLMFSRPDALQSMSGRLLLLLAQNVLPSAAIKC